MANSCKLRPAPRPVVIGLAGHDAALGAVTRTLDAAAAAQQVQLDLRRFDLVGLESPDAVDRLLRTARKGGFHALHFSDPLRRDITEFVQDRQIARLGGHLVDTICLGEGNRSAACDAGTLALEDLLARFLHGRRARHVLIVGAGTEGQSVAMALAALGVERLTFYDRDMSRAACLANLVTEETRARSTLLAATSGLFHEFSRPGVTRGWIDGIVNATPVGSARRPGQVLPSAGIEAPLWILDTAATEGSTPLSRLAMERGCPLLTGEEIAHRRGERLFLCSTGSGLLGCKERHWDLGTGTG